MGTWVGINSKERAVRPCPRVRVHQRVRALLVRLRLPQGQARALQPRLRGVPCGHDEHGGEVCSWWLDLVLYTGARAKSWCPLTQEKASLTWLDLLNICHLTIGASAGGQPTNVCMMSRAAKYPQTPDQLTFTAGNPRRRRWRRRCGRNGWRPELPCSEE